ncbi:MAG: NADH:ubiquinone reductase (Na(+)-transporting) subunit B [Bacteroidales bacterium]|nr:NADH:ubiquinone reductase (Na(+)-transporting) subunit B [Bacteroidales bacterium]
MKALRNYLDSVKPNFEKGGKYEKFQSTFEAFESFLFAPGTINEGGVHVRDGVDLKRVISMVIVALIPATIFGIWNSGYQYFQSIGIGEPSVLDSFLHGLYIFLPMVVVSYIVGLGIEFATAQIRGEQVNEGFLATGLLIPLVLPAGVPLWMVAIATAFSVIFAKEVFGGTGMNIWNPALIARAFLFFAYPSKMSGDTVWYYGSEQMVDGFTGATALSQANGGSYVDFYDAFMGWIPGSIGETSALCILLGAIFLLWTGVASWKTMLSVFVGGALTAWCFNTFGPETSIAQLPWYDHLVYGGFCFGAVFMATDPVTSCRTEVGKYIYGLLIGFVAIVVRVLNPGYPEGMMLAILFMNTMAPLIDYIVVEQNVSRRKKRAIASK